MPTDIVEASVNSAPPESLGQSRKVIYLLPRLNLSDTNLLGVKKKVLGQIQAFRDAGFEVMVVDTPEVLVDPLVNVSPEPRGFRNRVTSILNWPVHRAKSFLRNTRNASFALREIRNGGSAHVYVRHSRTTPGLILFYIALNRLQNVIRIYLEIPTWPFRYEGQTKFLDRTLWPLIRHLVQRVITFSEASSIVGLKTINITNGVSAEDNPPIRPQQQSQQPFKMVFVGQLYPWSGLDRLLSGFACYLERGLAQGLAEFHIAGTGKMLDEWKQLSAKLHLSDNVFFHGACSGEQLELVYRGAQIAIGNLANHRRQLETNADLKNREYCMRGLPFVAASNDPAFPDAFRFRMKVSPDDTAIDVNAIIHFLKQLSLESPDYPESMRRYAIQHLQWATTMLPVFRDMRK